MYVCMLILILRLSSIVAAVAAVYQIDQSSTLLHSFSVDESESFASVIWLRRKLLGLRLHRLMTSLSNLFHCGCWYCAQVVVIGFVVCVNVWLILGADEVECVILLIRCLRSKIFACDIPRTCDHGSCNGYNAWCASNHALARFAPLQPPSYCVRLYDPSPAIHGMF